MEIIIRSATPCDIDAAFAVECGAFPTDERASYSAFQERIDAFPQTFLLAELDKKIIGHINSGSWDHPYFDDILYKDITSYKSDGLYQIIYGLGVLPEYRCLGIAQSLIEYIIAFSISNNKKGVVLSCKEELIPYYIKFGFVNQGPSRSDLGGENWYDMLLTF